MKLLNHEQMLTDEAANALVDMASVLDCECPRHLVSLLRQIREFKRYEQYCLTRTPQDRQTHEWLYNAANNLDRMLSGTIVELARLESMVDEEGEIVSHPNRL